jgi:hypothetical protein
MLYASKIVKARDLQKTCKLAKKLFSEGREVEANILLLRIAGRRGAVHER